MLDLGTSERSHRTRQPAMTKKEETYRRFRAREGFGTAEVPREAQKAAKITRSCAYRRRKGRITWDYRKAGRRCRQRKEVIDEKVKCDCL